MFKHLLRSQPLKQSASVRYRMAVGPIARRKTFRLQVPGAIATPVESVKPLTADQLARMTFGAGSSG